MFRRLVCACAVLAVLWAAAVFSQEKKPFEAGRHKPKEVVCIACHNEPKPKTAASAETCLTCHQSMEAVAEKTKDRTPNPHQNHVTEASDLECTQCHHEHKTDTPLCHQCHIGMEFEKRAAETK